MTNIPESALIVCNDIIGWNADIVAYSDWEALRKDLLTLEGRTAEELDELESLPEHESEIYEAELTKQEAEDRGLYLVSRWYNEGYGRMKEIQEVWRIYWDDNGTQGEPQYLGEPDDVEEE